MTKEKKRFLPSKYLKKNSLAFNILQQRKRKIFRSKYLKKNLATSHSISMHLTTKKKKDFFDRNILKKSKFIRIRYQYFTTKEKKDFSIEILKKKPRVSKPAGIRHQYREINLRALGSIKNTILGVTNPCKKIVSIRHKDYI